MTFDLIKTEIKDRIGYVILNKPEKRNALDAEMVGQLRLAFEDFYLQDSVKVIVLKAEGKAFCSGADLASIQKLQENTYEENLEDSQNLKELFSLIYTGPKVVIAQIQGHALAGGCGLATLCDFSFSVPHALFGYTEVRIGFVPALVSLFLIRKIGESEAKKLLLSGELISAAEAVRIGLIQEVVEDDELDQKVNEFARLLIEQNSGTAMAMTKQMIAQLRGMSLEEALDFAAAQNAIARGTQECKNGIQAFLNKQKIVW
jgi:methylglutaconyl-CoA hydratase